MKVGLNQWPKDPNVTLTACIDSAQTPHATCQVGSKLRQRHSIFNFMLITSPSFSAFFFLHIPGPTYSKDFLQGPKCHSRCIFCRATSVHGQVLFLDKIFLSSWTCALDTILCRKFLIYFRLLFLVIASKDSRRSLIPLPSSERLLR